MVRLSWFLSTGNSRIYSSHLFSISSIYSRGALCNPLSLPQSLGSLFDLWKKSHTFDPRSFLDLFFRWFLRIVLWWITIKPRFGRFVFTLFSQASWANPRFQWMGRKSHFVVFSIRCFIIGFPGSLGNPIWRLHICVQRHLFNHQLYIYTQYFQHCTYIYGTFLFDFFWYI